MPDIQWQAMFSLSIHPGELFFRASFMYWFLFGIFRFLLRRDVGNMGLGDFLFVVIVADASQNAINGDARTLTDGLLLVLTLAFWNYWMDFMRYKFSAVRRLLQPESLLLVKDDRLQRKNLRREYISPEEIFAKLREQGIASLSQVQEMRLEADGEISVVKPEKH